MATPVTIRCRENGPYLVLGAVTVVDHLGNAYTPPPGKNGIALCRCGHSKTRPFCDGTHKTCAFQASELAPAQPGA